VKTTVNGVDVRSEYWFAADTGIVKQLFLISGKPVSIELQKYVPTAQ
jgi:hypothetical protein